MARIQVVYTPIADGNVGAYHQFLLYTRDGGDQYYVRGGSGASGGDNFFGEASGSKGPVEPSSYGNITVHTGRYKPNTPDYPAIETDLGYALDRKQFDSWHKKTVLEGPEAQLDWKWDEIEKHAIAIGGQNIPYRPLTQNSNSLASECLRRSGIDAPGQGLPWGAAVGIRPWAPGVGNSLDFAHDPPARRPLSGLATERAPDVEGGGATRSSIFTAALEGLKDFSPGTFESSPQGPSRKTNIEIGE